MTKRRKIVKTTEPNKPLGGVATTEIVKAVATGLVALLGGYLGALLISPDELYRRVFAPDPDRYLGQWQGMVGGRPVVLDIQEQALVPESKKTYIVKGILGYTGNSNKVEVEGTADSNFILSGRVEGGDLNIALQHEEPKARSPSARFVRLVPPEGDVGARICPITGDITKIVSIEECPPVPGATLFFR